MKKKKNHKIWIIRSVCTEQEDSLQKYTASIVLLKIQINRIKEILLNKGTYN